MKKQKHAKKTSYRIQLVASLLVLGAVGTAVQASANLKIHPVSYPKQAAIVLAAPKPAATVAPAKAVKSTPAPAAVAAVRKPSARVAYVYRPLPIVKPAPHSSVTNLVPVTPVASSTPTPTPSGQTPGVGSSTPATYSSSNWAGYMSPAGHFTGISGAWTVPAATGNGVSTSADATWIGIGGVTTSDLIQVGTDDSVSATGQESSEAFYELLPADSTPVVSMNVNPGDSMTAQINLVSGSTWQITISDTTRAQTYSTTVTYSSSESSAEWIEEDPSFASGRQIPFDSFGSASFTSAVANVGSASENLGQDGAQEIRMVNRFGQTVAIPSAIGSDSESFNIGN